MPVVSVIIPAWRAEGFIAAAISSARAQTLTDIEIVVVDDASPDDTQGAVRRAAAGDARVRLIVQPQNGGPASARNAALDAARGEWIAVLDADDQMAPERLERLVAHAEATNADIVADDMLVTPDLNDIEAGKAFLGRSGRPVINLSDFARDNQLFKGRRQSGYLKPMFRAACLRDHALRYDPGVRIGEDYVIVAQALASGARYIYVADPMYYYLVRPGSVSRVLTKADVDSLIAADERFMALYRSRLDHAALKALAARRASLDDAAAYIGVLDDLKARRFGAAMGTALRRPTAMRHLHMPVIVRIVRLWRVLRGASGREALA